MFSNISDTFVAKNTVNLLYLSVLNILICLESRILNNLYVTLIDQSNYSYYQHYRDLVLTKIWMNAGSMSEVSLPYIRVGLLKGFLRRI